VPKSLKTKLRGTLPLPSVSVFLAVPPKAPDALFSVGPTPEETARRRLQEAQAAYDDAAARVASAAEEEKPAAFEVLARAKDALHEAGRALREVRLGGRSPP